MQKNVRLQPKRAHSIRGNRWKTNQQIHQHPHPHQLLLLRLVVLLQLLLLLLLPTAVAMPSLDHLKCLRTKCGPRTRKHHHDVAMLGSASRWKYRYTIPKTHSNSVSNLFSPRYKKYNISRQAQQAGTERGHLTTHKNR